MELGSTALYAVPGTLQKPLATMLRQRGGDIKTAQELLRHANSRITLEIYQQSAEKREAQDRVMEVLC